MPWIQEIQHAKPTAVNKYREEVKLTFTAPAYDLETILDALPSVIEKEGSGNNIYFKMNKNRVWYENSCNCDSSEYCPVNIYYRIDRQKNESLADTAGRLLIQLFEAGIINFKK